MFIKFDQIIALRKIIEKRLKNDHASFLEHSMYHFVCRQILTGLNYRSKFQVP